MWWGLIGLLPINPKTAKGRHTCNDLGMAREKYQCHGKTPHSTDLFCTVLNINPVPGDGDGGGRGGIGHRIEQEGEFDSVISR